MKRNVQNGADDCRRCFAFTLALTLLALTVATGCLEPPELYVWDVTEWEDPVSSLTWQNPSPEGYFNWPDAKQYCSELSHDGGGWRLPTIGELRSLIRGCDRTQSGGICNIGEEEGGCLAESCRYVICDGCASESGPAAGCYWPGEMQGNHFFYWSSTAVTGEVGVAWGVNFDTGDVLDTYNHIGHVRCVR